MAGTPPLSLISVVPVGAVGLVVPVVQVVSGVRRDHPEGRPGLSSRRTGHRRCGRSPYGLLPRLCTRVGRLRLGHLHRTPGLRACNCPSGCSTFPPYPRRQSTRRRRRHRRPHPAAAGGIRADWFCFRRLPATPGAPTLRPPSHHPRRESAVLRIATRQRDGGLDNRPLGHHFCCSLGRSRGAMR